MTLPTFTYRTSMQLLAVLTILCMLAACNRQRNKEIIRVEFAESTCFEPCVPIAISMDSALHYQFYVDSSYVKRAMAQGNYRGAITRELWDELTAKLEDIDYRHLHTGNDIFPSDIQKVELIVYWGNRKTHLETVMDSHTEVGKVLYWIDSTYKQVKLKPVTDSLHFGTILQLDPRITHHE